MNPQIKRTLCIFITASLLALSGSGLLAQGYWMQRAGGSTADEGYSISLDANNNTYTTGYFTGTANFGTTNLTALGVSDIFITKTNSNGVYQWAVKAGDGGSDRGLAIASDSKGNSYITGYYYGTAIFGTQSITSVGLQDIFVAKYNSAGILKWVVSAGGTESDIGNGIAVDNTGNVIITGEFTGTATFGSFNLTSTANNINVFTAKLDSANGNFIWAKSGVGAHTDRGIAVACDPNGNSYVTGQFTDTITFDTPHYSPFYDAIFVVKYNSAGVEQWITTAGAGTMNIANAIAVDKNSNVYITGNFTGTLTFYANITTSLTPPYTNGIFVAKYDDNANLLWDVADGSSSAVTSNGIGVDATGNAYIIGNFECLMNSYANQYGQGTFNSVGDWDIFTAEYSTTSGAWQWSRQIGGHANNYGYSIAVSTTADLYTTGSFDQDMIITADPPPSFLGYNATAATYCNTTYCSDSHYGYFANFNTAGNLDIFIAKPINLNRQPYDFYIRTGAPCNRPQVGVCIGQSIICEDTVSFCISGVITAIPNTCNIVGPDFIYLWSTSSRSNAISVSRTGWYSVTQTSANGCIKSKDSIYVIIHPAPPQPCLSDNVVINTNSTNPKPIRVCDGPVILTGCNFSGDSAWYWTTPNSLVKKDSVSITVGLLSDSGYYCFNVVDSFGCVNQTCVWVAIDSALPNIGPKIKCLNCQHDSIFICKGGGFTLLPYDTISNPSANPADCIPPSASTTNKWIASPATVSYHPTTGCPDQNTFTPSDSGWYHVTDTIVSANACGTNKHVVKDSVFVRLYPSPIVTLTLSGNTIVCPGDSEWIVATSNTNFTWSTGSTMDSIYVGPGSYFASASVTNAYGCTASASGSISITNATIPAPSVSMNPATGVVCPGDSVQLSCTGGPYQYYEWYGPSGPLSSTTSTAYVNAPGSYYCFVGDSLPCPLSKLSNTVITELYATPYLALPANLNLCPGDSINVSVQASSNATITWLPPLSGDSANQVIKAAGTYSVEVISCGITTICTVTITSSTPISSITVAPSKTICIAGDSVTLTAASGMASYLWSPGGNTNLIISVKNAGIYTLTATDSHGCTATSDVTIYPPLRDSVTLSKNISCMGGSTGSITIGVSGGASAYTYTWTPFVSSGPTASNLSAGTYSVIVEDANGCEKTASVTITQPPTLLTSAILSSADVNCFGNSNGLATVGATGGVPSYTYLWDPGLETTPTVTGLSAGSYTVVVSDSAGCSVTSTVSITQPNATVSTLTTVQATCANNDGSISAAITGGTSPYTYSWNPGGGTNSSISGLSAGVYTVIVTDAHGCLDTVTGTVSLDSTFSLKVKGLDSICKGQTDTLTASGATSYLWSNGNTSSTLIVTPTGSVSYWVTGATGVCKDSVLHTISIYKPLAANMPPGTRICPGMPVTLKVNVAGGKPKFNYAWNNGITTNSQGPITVYPTDSTTYIVTITDGCNDLVIDSTHVDVYPKGNINFKPTPDTIPGGQTVNFTYTGQNNTSWYWTFGDGGTSSDSDPQHIYSEPGVYVVTLYGDNSYGCPDTVVKDVYVTPEILIPNVFSPNGDGVNDIFYFTITGATCFHCDIFNCWGVLVYQLNDVAEGWPGIIRQTNEPASEGTYYYVLNYCDYMNVTHKLDGFITLIRGK